MNITEDALFLLRTLLEHGFASNHDAPITQVKELSGVNGAAYNQAEKYLFDKKFIDGRGSGSDGFIWITANGIDYVEHTMQSRIPLSLNAERIFKIIVETADIQIHKRVQVDDASKISKLDIEIVKQAFQELHDEGLIECPVNQRDGRKASVLQWGAVASSEGRNTLRRNFRLLQPPTTTIERVTGSQMNSKSTGNQVFIGHGRTLLWRDLKDFLQDRIKLPWEEFNRVPVAGITNVARLSEMLDNSAFAFLVMTAEDEQSDGRMNARMNVIHEAGLFQGRLGFNKAILLLEEGCEEFSNIQGLGQIRFPKGNIKAAFEDIRQVLERENIIS